MNRLLLLAFVFATAIAAAQSPETTQPSGRDQLPSMPDRAFMKKLAESGLAEVDAGNLAARKATAPAVKELAQRMVDDHSRANEELRALAKHGNVDLPTAPDSAHVAEAARLSKESGAHFEQDYIAGQLKDHQQTVRLLQDEISGASSPAVERFAQRTLPVVSQHLAMVEKLSQGGRRSSARR
jgi:putative membrane protein